MRAVHRLRASADFERVRALKRFWSHSLLVLYTAPNEIGQVRLGVSVSRRIGKAVVRNRIRRRIREATRRFLRDLPCPEAASADASPRQGQDLLFIARARSGAASWDTLQTAVYDLLLRAQQGSGRLLVSKGA
jgi:ribonuclease P protein component